MSAKRFFIMSCVLVAAFQGVVACMPATGTPSRPPQGNGGGALVDVTPMPDAELMAQPAGQSAPGAGAATSDVTPQGTSVEGVQTHPGPAKSYVNSVYKFGVDYPADFVLRSQPAEKLAQLAPKPISAFTFMNPVLAASDVVELELADLEIRVHARGQATTLDSWLAASGLAPADGSVSQQPFKTANVSGVKTCASTMIVPGCFYFVLGSGWIYQLIPTTLQGEAMMDTFVALP